MIRASLLFGCVLCASITAAEPDRPVAIRGAEILPVSSKPIANGILLIHKGKILALGKEGSVGIPKEARVVDARGKVIIPGLVDTHSHIGLWGRPNVPGNSDGNEASGPVQSGLRALDAIHPRDPGIKMAVAGGVTTANIMPGSANVIGGQTLYVKLRGSTVEEMQVKGKVLGGLKMANGENPKRWNFEKNKMPPSTRMKLAALQREQFLKAKAYQAKWQKYRKDKVDGREATPPDRDIHLEPLVEVLEGKRTVHFHSHRADDLMSAIRLSKELGFELVLQHATEGYLVKEELARHNIPVSLTLLDSPGGKLEVVGLLEENAAILNKAGIKVAINTDDAITESRFFLRTGALAVRGGMSEQAALAALTLNGAAMMHLDHRLGSLAPGKDADFVILSGPPFSVYTQVLETWIDGKQVFDRASEEDAPYQTGGFAVARGQKIPSPAPVLKPFKPVSAPEKPRIRPNRKRSGTTVILAGRIHTVANGDITNGAILVKQGRIEWVGPRSELKIPEGASILSSAVVTPGLIDAHSVAGVAGALNIGADQDQNEESNPNQADLRVIDGFNPNEPLLEYLRREGVTIVHAVPGPSNVIAGQSGIFRTAGSTAERMAIRFPAGLLINLGEIPKSAYKNTLPTTRMGTASLSRKAHLQAANHAQKKNGPVDLKAQALQMASMRKIPTLFAAHRADDIQTALRLSQELGLKAQIHAATEGYLFRKPLKKAGVEVVVHPTLQRAGNLETYHTHVGNAAALANAEIPIAIGGGYEAYVPKTRVVRFEAAMAMVHGLGFERALRAITLDAARILEIDKQYGSIERGKVADLVLYDGNPFEHSTHVESTLISGRVVYSRSDYLKLPFARRALPLRGGGVGCCLFGW